MARGHVRKRGATWSYVQPVFDPATGKQKYRWRGGFRTRREAQSALQTALRAAERDIDIPVNRVSFREYVEKDWLPAMRHQVEYSTWESYERNLRLHVLPAIGGTRLQALKARHLNELYKELLEAHVRMSMERRTHDPRVYDIVARRRAEGWSYQRIAERVQEEVPGEAGITRHAVARVAARLASDEKEGRIRTLSVRTVRYIHTIISGVLRDARRQDLVERNVASLASPPTRSRVKRQKQLWTGEQTRRFLLWAREENLRLWPAWAFIATSGDRRGANLGLHWADIDFDAGTAGLSWTVTCVRREIIVKPYTKTGPGHEIILDPPTIAILKWWRARQLEQRLAFGISHECPSVEPSCVLDGYHNRDLVFCRPDGNYLHPERFSREFKRAQDRYNRLHPDEPLPIVNLHALRHGWATLALEAGVPMKVVQDRLDHSTERITADLYTHVRHALQSDAAERVAEAIFGPDYRLRLQDGS